MQERAKLNSPTPHPLGEYVKDRRVKAGLSIRQLADLVGVHQSFLSRMELGIYSQPGPDILQRLAKALSAPPEDLFALVGYELPENLPTFPAYLRSKYEISPEAAKQLNDYFEFLRTQYPITEKKDDSSSRTA